MHIVQCNSVDAANTFSMTFAELGIWLQKTTSKEIETAVTDLVLELRAIHKVENTYGSDIMEAVETQRAMGTYPFVRGFLSKKWIDLQGQY